MGFDVTLAAHTDPSGNLPGRSAGCLFSSSSIHQGLSRGGKLFGHLTHDPRGPGVLLGLLENRAACLFLATAGWS